MEITHLADSSNRKMTSVCQEQIEHGGGTENKIREESVSTRVRSFNFIVNVMGSLSERVVM